MSFENLSPPDFWSLADEYPDLVTGLHNQARLMGAFGLNGSVPWLKDTEGALCFICKEDVENTKHFFLDCPQFKENFDSVWRNLQLKITRSNPTDSIQIANFIKNLNHQNKVMLLVFPYHLITKPPHQLRSLCPQPSVKSINFALRNYVSWRNRG